MMFLRLAESSALYKIMPDSAILLGVTIVILVIYLSRYRRRKKLPPGPTGLPFFGYYPFLRKDPLGTVKTLAKKYGNIVGLYLGSQYVVFLNDWNAIKDALSQNATVDKPPELFSRFPYKFGVGGANGEEWVETRRLSSKVMKDGLQKDNWEDLVQEEVFDMVKRISEEEGNPINAPEFFSESFANNVMSLIMGERLYVGHPVTKMVSQSVDFIMENSGNFNLVNFSSKLAKLLQTLRLQEDSKIGSKLMEFIHFWSDTVDSKIQNSTGPDDSYIVRFHEEIENSKKNKENSYFTEGTLKGTVISVVTGGSETTRTTLLWLLIAMAEYPDKQRKVHEELDNVIGKEASIHWSDRSKVPYTLAAIMESMRWKTTVPFPGMRIASKNTQIQGYHIPKGTFILSSNALLHGDEIYWENPEQFIPERFLIEDGKKINASPDSWNPFSYGKRNCPGKLLAMMQMLLYFSALMQKFEVRPERGTKVQYEAHLGFSYQPKKAELRFIPR